MHLNKPSLGLLISLLHLLFPFGEPSFILISMPSKLVSPSIVFISSNNPQRDEEATEFSLILGIPIKSCWRGLIGKTSQSPPVFWLTTGSLGSWWKQAVLVRGSGAKKFLTSGHGPRTSVEIKRKILIPVANVYLPCNNLAESLFPPVSFLFCFWARCSWESSSFRNWCTLYWAEKRSPGPFQWKGAPS